MQTSSDQLIDLYVPRNAYHELFWVFGPFYTSGTQDAEVTKLLYIFTLCNRPFLDCGLKFFVPHGLPCHTAKVRFLSPKTPRLGDSLEDYWNSGEDDEKEDNLASKHQEAVSLKKIVFSRVLGFRNTRGLPTKISYWQKNHDLQDPSWGKFSKNHFK